LLTHLMRTTCLHAHLTISHLQVSILSRESKYAKGFDLLRTALGCARRTDDLNSVVGVGTRALVHLFQAVLIPNTQDDTRGASLFCRRWFC
jgi:hypothetical protein